MCSAVTAQSLTMNHDCSDVLLLCSDTMSMQLNQYAAVLHKTSSLCGNFAMPARLHCLLRNLVVQSLHHRDVVQSEFTWQVVLVRFSVIITHVPRLRFNGHFPGGPVLAGTRMSPFRILLELRVMEVVVTTGAIWRAKLQSKCHHQQTNT